MGSIRGRPDGHDCSVPVRSRETAMPWVRLLDGEATTQGVAAPCGSLVPGVLPLPLSGLADRAEPASRVGELSILGKLIKIDADLIIRREDRRAHQSGEEGAGVYE